VSQKSKPQAFVHIFRQMLIVFRNFFTDIFYAKFVTEWLLKCTTTLLDYRVEYKFSKISCRSWTYRKRPDKN